MTLSVKAFFKNAPSHMVLLRHPVLLMLSSLLILLTLLFVFSQKMRGWGGGEEGEEVNPLYSYTNEEPIN